MFLASVGAIKNKQLPPRIIPPSISPTTRGPFIFSNSVPNIYKKIRVVMLRLLMLQLFHFRLMFLNAYFLILSVLILHGVQLFFVLLLDNLIVLIFYLLLLLLSCNYILIWIVFFLEKHYILPHFQSLY